MRVLLIHTFYTQKGGEDAVFKAEKELLETRHVVDELLFNNHNLNSLSPLKQVKNLFYNSSSYIKLEEKIKTFKPDVIHIHNLFYEASPSILYAAQKYKVPTVITLHNYRLICANALLLRESKICELCVKKAIPLHGIKNKCFQDSALKTALLIGSTSYHKLSGTWRNKVSRYIVFSEFQKSKILNSSLSLKESQVSIKPNFVEDCEQGDFESRDNYYLFIGRLSKEKGVDLLLNAQKIGGFELEIIGGGELEDTVKSEANHNSKVTFHGFQQKEFILNKLKKAKALIFPSIWYEGMPITVLESLSTGTPIIMSDMDNISDMIEDGENGILFKSGNAISLAASINSFESILKPTFYSNAFETFQKKYSKERNLSLLEAIYISLSESTEIID
ncbi:glycosyltransferase [Vicingaceae bacterium]|nr:glycosyltransferase [Vicingaceae bacterium]